MIQNLFCPEDPKEREVVIMSGRILLLWFCVVFGVHANPAPSLTVCKKDDSVCLTKNANIMYKLAVDGVPELNIEKLEPIHQDEIEGDLVVIKYKLYNSTIEGYSSCDLINTKLDLKESKLNIKMFCPYFDMYGLYEISGKILVMAIEGSGDYRIQCKDYHIQVDTDIKVNKRKDGKKYMSFKRFKVNADLQGGMISNLTNLFNGRQNELAEAVLKFVNKNWKPVADELQGPVYNANVKKIIKNFNKYLKTVPMDQFIQE